MKENINDEYRKIMQDLENNIENERDLNYAKSQLEKISMMFINEMERITKYYETKVDKLDAKQNELENKLQNVQKALDGIEKDIYDGEVDDGAYEFEITCPYCNYDFVAELDELKDEIQCPECKNTIELDWNESDEGCAHGCSGCHGCEDDDM